MSLFNQGTNFIYENKIHWYIIFPLAFFCYYQTFNIFISQFLCELLINIIFLFCYKSCVFFLSTYVNPFCIITDQLMVTYQQAFFSQLFDNKFCIYYVTYNPLRFLVIEFRYISFSLLLFLKLKYCTTPIIIKIIMSYNFFKIFFPSLKYI